MKSVPRVGNHYLWAQTNKEFIEGRKTISQLHKDYQLESQLQNKHSANYHIYSDIFNKAFNISLLWQKKCRLCFQYGTGDEQTKDQMKKEYGKHLKEKIVSRKEKDSNKLSANNLCKVVWFDMQVVL